MIISREIWTDIKRGGYKARNDIERAATYYYRLQLSFSSAGGNFKMNKGKLPRVIWRDFMVYSERLKRVTIERMDFARLIAEYDAADTFFYLDPPYYGNEVYYEGKHFGKGDHERLRDALAKVKGKWLLSYNDHHEIRDLYKAFNVSLIGAIYTFGKKQCENASELLISNY
jgi:DNA adenine methylase